MTKQILKGLWNGVGIGLILCLPVIMWLITDWLGGK